MKKEQSVNDLKFKYLLAEFKQTHNSKFAIEICDMIINGELKFAASRKDDKLLFIIASKYKSKCCKCNEMYTYGDPIFVRNQKAWHVKCASKDELNHEYFQESVKKGLIDDFDPKSLDI